MTKFFEGINIYDKHEVLACWHNESLAKHLTESQKLLEAVRVFFLKSKSKTVRQKQ